MTLLSIQQPNANPHLKLEHSMASPGLFSQVADMLDVFNHSSDLKQKEYQESSLNDYTLLNEDAELPALMSLESPTEEHRRISAALSDISFDSFHHGPRDSTASTASNFSTYDGQWSGLSSARDSVTSTVNGQDESKYGYHAYSLAQKMQSLEVQSASTLTSQRRNALVHNLTPLQQQHFQAIPSGPSDSLPSSASSLQSISLTHALSGLNFNNSPHASHVSSPAVMSSANSSVFHSPFHFSAPASASLTSFPNLGFSLDAHLMNMNYHNPQGHHSLPRVHSHHQQHVRKPPSALHLLSSEYIPKTETEIIRPKKTHHKSASMDDSITDEVLACPFEGCDKTFNRPFNLKSHLKSHASERPHQCEYCPATFRRCHDLKRHQRSLHSMVKPFSCGTCVKTFSRLDALRRHISRPNSQCFRAEGI